MVDKPIFIFEERNSLNPRNKDDPALGHPPPEQAQWPAFTFMGLKKMSDENDNLAEVRAASETISPSLQKV